MHSHTRYPLYAGDLVRVRDHPEAAPWFAFVVDGWDPDSRTNTVRVRTTVSRPPQLVDRTTLERVSP